MEDLKDDILEGGPEIRDFMGFEGSAGLHKTYRMLEQGHIPAEKVGGKWFSLKSVIRESVTRRVSGSNASTRPE